MDLCHCLIRPYIDLILISKEHRMATAKKKTSRTKTKAPAKTSWSDTIKSALKNKRPAGGFPDQGKPRDSTVQKVKKDAF